MMETALYDIFELKLETPAGTESEPIGQARALFTMGHRTVEVRGFADGDSRYLIRFMPDREGEWSYTVKSGIPEWDGREGAFLCTPAREVNHGPVRVRDSYHFVHDDGTPHLSFGTTCYAWAHQSREQQEQTLETLASAPFNKMRMCVFPKWYPYNRVEPEQFPFERKGDAGWDWERFNPAFFRNFEKRIEQLRELGIQADLILFHPYDEHWGFDKMPAEADDRYLEYVTARFSAYANVWWSFANEFDLMEAKTTADWDRFFKIVQEKDPYGHLRGIHNCRGFYDHAKGWVTHCSVQHSDLTRVRQWRNEYGKPVVVDECCYEGNIQFNWGNITAREMVDRFWLGMTNGGYVGHGETYVHREDLLWWSKGGVLHGESPERIAFLRKLLEEDVRTGKLTYLDTEKQTHWNTTGYSFFRDRYFLWYFGMRQPAERTISLPEDKKYRIDVIDAWDMTVETLGDSFSGETYLTLPGKAMTALRAVVQE